MKNYSFLKVESNSQLDEELEYNTSEEYFKYLCDCYSKFQSESPDEYLFIYRDRLPEELAYFALFKKERNKILH